MECDVWDVIGVLRKQAWERAKGELNAVLGTYHGTPYLFAEMDKLVTEFIKHVEDHGLEE